MSNNWSAYIAKQKPNTNLAPAEDIFYPSSLDGFFEVSGQDALKFLQGQLTCDVNKVTPDHSSLGSHCNAKGRMQSSFRLLSKQTDSYIFCLNSLVKEQAIAALQKYIVFSKAEIIKHEDHAMIGLHGARITEFLESFLSLPNAQNGVSQYNGCLLVCTDQETQSYELLGPSLEIISICDKLAKDFQFCIPQHHNLRLNQLGQAFVDENTINEFTPQSFNYQCFSAVSFDKGCYTGQEIVARLHYLGKLKRNMFHFEAASESRLTSGMPVSIEGKTVGHILSAVEIASGKWDLLINLENSLVPLSNLSTESGHIEAIQQIPLPYEIRE